MKFVISCEIFARLASVTEFFEPSTVEETQKLLRCVRIENKDGHSFGIATNQKIAAIQYLGTTEEPDGVIHVVNDPVLVNKCKEEAAFDSFMEVVSIPEMAIASAQTVFGYSYPGNVGIFPDETPMDKWRKWFPDKLAATNQGVMCWTVDQVLTLAKASPSGKIYFPKFYNTDEPLVLCDLYDKNWVGLFVPSQETYEKQPTEYAEIPKWLGLTSFQK